MKVTEFPDLKLDGEGLQSDVKYSLLDPQPNQPSIQSNIKKAWPIFKMLVKQIQSVFLLFAQKTFSTKCYLFKAIFYKKNKHVLFCHFLPHLTLFLRSTFLFLLFLLYSWIARDSNVRFQKSRIWKLQDCSCNNDSL